MSDKAYAELCNCDICVNARMEYNQKRQLPHLSTKDLLTVAERAIEDKFKYLGMYETKKKRYNELKATVEKLTKQNDEMMSMLRFTNTTPQVLQPVPYEQFVEDMTLAQVSTLQDHMRGMVAEVGELNGKVYKADRDNNGQLDKQALLLELGDIQFYLTGVANRLGFTLKEILQANRAKLMARKLNGTIQGEGDKR